MDVSTDADSPKLGLPGRPCYNGWVDVKATDDQPTPLWGLIPLRPSPKTVARVELDTAVTVAGVLPLGLPDINPEWVAAIVVNEDAANWQTNALAVRGTGFLIKPSTSPSGTEGLNVYQGTLTGECGVGCVNLNGANNFGVFILTSLSPTAPSLTGSLNTICGQTPVPAGQVECLAYDGSGQEVSFIHSYSTSAAPTAASPKLSTGAYHRRMSRGPICTVFQPERRLPVVNGCEGGLLRGWCGQESDGSPVAWRRVRRRHEQRGNCELQHGGASSSWTIVFTPPDASTSTGRYPITLGWKTYKLKNNGDCSNNTNTSGTLGTAGAPYTTDVDDNSGGIQYLTVTYAGNPANSIDQPTAADLEVTVGFQPALQDTPLTDTRKLSGWVNSTHRHRLRLSIAAQAARPAGEPRSSAAVLRTRSMSGTVSAQRHIRTRARRTVSMPKTDRST